MTTQFKNIKTTILEITNRVVAQQTDQLVQPTVPVANITVHTTPSVSDSDTSNELASQFFALTRSIATVAHFDHLTTDSFSKHSALDTFYKDIIDLLDDFSEAYIGLYSKFLTLPVTITKTQEAITAIQDYRSWIETNRNQITNDSSLQNIIDEIYELCNSTLYKLTKLG